MHSGIAAVGPEQQPVAGHDPAMALFFVGFLIIGRGALFEDTHTASMRGGPCLVTPPSTRPSSSCLWPLPQQEPQRTYLAWPV